MPVLKRNKPFKQLKPPSGIKKEDKVFFLPLTNEIFTDYDAFFERTIHLNSMIWICSVTGRAGLTFEEALESEKEAQKALDDFPEFLEAPILYLTHKFSHRGRIDDLVSDIFNFMKERYFVGEELTLAEGKQRKLCRIRHVKYIGAPVDYQQNGTQENGGSEEQMMGTTSASGNKKKTVVGQMQAPFAHKYRYDVQIVDDDSSSSEDESDSDDDDNGLRTDVLPKNLSRSRYTAPKPAVKLFVKNSCFLNGDHWTLKPSLVSDYQLDSVEWDRVFGGPMPKFPHTPVANRRTSNVTATKAQEGGSSSSSDSSSDEDETKEKSEIASRKAAKVEVKKQGDEEAKPKRKRMTKKEREEKQRIELERKIIEKQQDDLRMSFNHARRANLPEEIVKKYEQTDRILTPDDINQLRMLTREARDKAKEQAKEEKRKEKEMFLEWKRIRDDLLCDDLKPLPEFPLVSLPDWLTGDMFGHFVSILEFFNNFSDKLNIREFHASSKVSFEDVLSAIIGRDPQTCPLVDLLNCLVHAKAERADEEDGDEANLENREEISYEGSELDNKRWAPAIRESTDQHETVRVMHGVSARHLPIDSLTATEVVRLQIITSGYYTGQITAKFRYTHRGGFRCWDDAGLIFRIKYPHIMDKLKTGTLFDLLPNERVLLLKMFVEQLLSYYGFRNAWEERNAKLLELKRELKSFKAWDQAQEKEGTNARWLREHEDEIKEMQAQQAETAAQNGNDNADVVPTKYERPPMCKDTTRLISWVHAQRDGAPTSRKMTENIEDMLLNDLAYNEMDVPDIMAVRQLQMERFELESGRLFKQIADLQSKCGLVYLGRDRAFNNYWYSESLPAVIKELPTELDNVGPCELPTPLDKVPNRPEDDDLPLNKSRSDCDLELRQQLTGCTGDMSNCPVHCPSFANRRSTENRFCYFGTTESVDTLVESLNGRGFRESELADNFRYFLPRIKQVIEQSCKTVLAEGGFLIKKHEKLEIIDSKIDWSCDVREMILDLEERVCLGGIGSVKVRSSREAWRAALKETGDVTSTCEDVKILNEIIYSAEELTKLDAITRLAVGLLHVAQGVQMKFMRLPWAAPPDPEEGENAPIIPAPGDGGNAPTDSFISWQKNLLECRSLSELALFASTLEPGILWSKSRLQARCRQCRKKCAHDNSVLCSACDRCVHIHCARPQLDLVPQGEWLCSDCKTSIAAEKRKLKKKEQQAKAAEESKEWMQDNNSDLFDNGAGDSDYAPECYGCGSFVRGNKLVKCSECTEVYHLECAKLKSVVKSWQCSNCGGGSSVAPSRDMTPEVTTTTSSGRMVKKTKHFVDAVIGEQQLKDDRKVSAALLAKRRGGRIRGVGLQNGYHGFSDDDSAGSSDLEYTGSGTKPKKRKTVDSLDGGSARSLSIGLRDGSWGRSKEWIKQCENVIKDAMRLEDSWAFCEPVDGRLVTDYYDIIKHPMDLHTMLNKLKNHRYDSPLEVRDDARLIITNCRIYNEDGSEIAKCANVLEQFFVDRFGSMFGSPPPAAHNQSNGRRSSGHKIK